MGLEDRPSAGKPGLMCYQMKSAMCGPDWSGTLDYWESLAGALGMTLNRLCALMEKREPRASEEGLIDLD